MSNKTEKNILEILAGKQYSADEYGRIVINDPEMLNLIKGSLGQSSDEATEAFWNGACSNQRCII